jgi:hypothetical protein
LLYRVQSVYAVRFEVFTAVTMKNAVLMGYKNPVRTSQETYYVSATEPSRLCYVRFAVFTAVTMKNVVFWDIKTQLVPHERHITSPLQSPAGKV